MSKLYKISKLLYEISEAFDFDNINPIPILKINDTTYKSTDRSVKISFQKVSDDVKSLHSKYLNATKIYNVVYTVNDLDTQSYKTDYANLISILKSVKLAIDEFIDENDPEVLIFMSMDKMGSVKTDPQKDKLYKYAIIKNIPSGYGVDYDVSPFNFTDMKGLILFRKDIKIPTK